MVKKEFPPDAAAPLPQIGPQLCALHHSSGKRDRVGSTGGATYRPPRVQTLGGCLVFSLAFSLFFPSGFTRRPAWPDPRAVP